MCKAKQTILHWLTKEIKIKYSPPCDFDTILKIVQPADVLLIQWHSRMSSIIAHLSQSPWTHAVLYIGKITDMKDPLLKQSILNHYHGDLNEPLILGGVVAKVARISPLKHYQKQHIRICRAIEITEQQKQQVLHRALSAIGYEPTNRQIWNLVKLMLCRTLLPQGLFDRLFKSHGYLKPQIYASIIAEAFDSARFPIMPLITRQGSGQYQISPKDVRTITPKDFDESPYFETIKHPLFGVRASQVYQQFK